MLHKTLVIYRRHTDVFFTGKLKYFFYHWLWCQDIVWTMLFFFNELNWFFFQDTLYFLIYSPLIATHIFFKRSVFIHKFLLSSTSSIHFSTVSVIYRSLSRLISNFRSMSFCLIRRFSWIIESGLWYFSRVTEIGRPRSSNTFVLPLLAAFGTSNSAADIFPIHTIISINCFHTSVNFEWRANF